MQRTVVERIRPIADDVVSVVVRGVEGPLEPWEPGAHVDIVLPTWLTRQYSLCGDPADRSRYRLAVRHDPLSRGGSEYVTTFLREGRELAVSAPRNTFRLADAPGYLFLAGGIGITAVLPMFRAVHAAGRPARLVYTGRSRTGMAFADDLADAYGDRVRIVASGRDGHPDLAALAAGLGPGELVYCCGPNPMLDAARAAFPAGRLHVERFRAAPRTHLPDTAFTVRCNRSGRVVPVPADRSMLDALLAADLPAASGCREGVCGSCELRLLGGEPEHRDDLGAAPGRIYPCVSRARSEELVVDL